jgi:hypothetical protein
MPTQSALQNPTTGLPTSSRPVLGADGRGSTHDRDGSPDGRDDWHTTAARPDGHGRRRARSGGVMMAGQMADRVKALGHQAGDSRRRSVLIIAIGLVVVVALGTIGALSGWFASGPDTPSTTTSNGPGPASAAPTPLIAVQEYRDRGIEVNVPKNWTKSGSGTYVDYADPASNGTRKIRINITDSTGTAQGFLSSAEANLKKPSVCPTPYKRLGLVDTQLAGKAGAQLEYTCGNAPSMRHGIWDVIISGGKAYSFYLTVPDDQFAESKVIFEEMVHSFQLIAS